MADVGYIMVGTAENMSSHNLEASEEGRKPGKYGRALDNGNSQLAGAQQIVTPS